MPRRSASSALMHNNLVFTSGVAAYGDDFIERALEAVREFTAFNEENDPYDEHDAGSFELDGVNLLWKIDCYDRLLDGRRIQREPSPGRACLPLFEGNRALP